MKEVVGKAAESRLHFWGTWTPVKGGRPTSATNYTSLKNFASQEDATVPRFQNSWRHTCSESCQKIHMRKRVKSGIASNQPNSCLCWARGEVESMIKFQHEIGAHSTIEEDQSMNP